MEEKTTLILGASPNNKRFSFLAAKKLVAYGHKIVLVGLQKGEIEGNIIHDINSKPIFEEIDTITLYMNPHNQIKFYDYIFELDPRRLIFNPGTENPDLVQKAMQRNINIVFDCTLVMLNTGNY